eukprot:12506797-Heterocapsa_arctica.AAC.1
MHETSSQRWPAAPRPRERPLRCRVQRPHWEPMQSTAPRCLASRPPPARRLGAQRHAWHPSCR